MRENINAIIKTATNPNADFAKMAASIGPAQRAAALAEAEKGLDALQKWRQAINQTIESAVEEERAACAPLSGERTKCVPTTSS
jgi:hypothetical protein